MSTWRRRQVGLTHRGCIICEQVYRQKDAQRRANLAKIRAVYRACLRPPAAAGALAT